MYFKDIVNALIATYKQIDLRLIISKSDKGSEVAFLRILFSGNQINSKKDCDFFNSLSDSLTFIQKILDSNYIDLLMRNLQNGELEINGQTYYFSDGERQYFQTDIKTESLYSEWTSDLYVRQQTEDDFQSLLMRAPYTTTCLGILAFHGVPNIVKGFDTSKVIHAFLDSSSINNDNSRIVVLLPVYSKLKQIISHLEVLIHRALVNDTSLHILNGDPKTIALSQIIHDTHDEIRHCVLDDLTRNSSQISLYSNSLDLELGKREIFDTSIHRIELPIDVRYSTENDLRLLIEMDESKNLERKLFLIYDRIKKCENLGKEFDTMRTIDSFLNSDGGVLIIGVDDNKNISGLSGDYSFLCGDRNSFDKFRNYLRDQIQNKYFKTTFVGDLIEIKRYVIDTNDICVIDVRRSPLPIFVYHPDDGQLFFVRQGDRTIKIWGLDLSSYLQRHFSVNSPQRSDEDLKR